MSIEAKKARTIQNLEHVLKKCIEILGEADDLNSVLYQLIDLAYKDSLYCCFNEGLRLDSKNQNSPKSIISLIHESFFASQLLSIRRLLDSGNDVQSLRRIFDIVYHNRGLFTREHFLRVKRCRFERKSDFLRDMAEEHFNRLYDGISKTSQHKRSSDDKLHEPHLDAIRFFLERPTLIRHYTDSYIAHAILKRKRKLSIADLDKINLANMQKLIRTISWLSFTLSRYIGELILFEVPTVTFDKFEGWQKSIFSRDIEHRLEELWCRRVSLFNAWKSKYWNLDRFYYTPTESIAVK